MFKVMLIDDEPWILEDLKNIIDWESFGYEVIGEAKSGAEAFALMKKQAPNLIISDIKMPGITGLELLGTINKKVKNVLTVFISAYSEFSFAQQAISLGAFDYLLKPVEKDKLCDTLIRAKQILLKIKTERENSIKLELLRIVSDITEKVSFSKVLSEAGVDVKNKQFYVGLAKTREGMPLPDLEKHLPNTEVFQLPIGKNKYLFFAIVPNEAGGIGFLRRLVKVVCSNEMTVGISAPFGNANDIQNALNQANVASDQGFITGKLSGCSFYRQQNPSQIIGQVKSLVSKDEVIRYIKLLPEKIIKNKINLDELYRIYCEIIKVIYSGSRDIEISGEDSKYLVETYQNFDEMIRSLENAASESMEGSVKEPSRSVIKEVLSYIENNYNKKLLINNIAKQFYLNSSYLSMLFKNETGKSFTNYLLELRLDKAVELLEKDSLSLYEISEMVGYDDYFHFSKLFKKYRGTSPANYRKQIKTHEATMKKHV